MANEKPGTPGYAKSEAAKLRHEQIRELRLSKIKDEETLRRQAGRIGVAISHDHLQGKISHTENFFLENNIRATTKALLKKIRSKSKNKK